MALPRISFQFWQALEPLLFCLKNFFKIFWLSFSDSQVLTNPLAIMMSR